MLVIGAAVVGIIIGFLAWFAILPLSRPVDWKTITSFISIALGAAITQLFPSGTEMFAGYCIGLGIGFFFVSAQYRSRQARELKKTLAQERLQAEIRVVQENWPQVERFVEERLKRQSIFLDLKGLDALPYSPEVKTWIMQEYARIHVASGVRFEFTSLFGPWLYGGDAYAGEETQSEDVQAKLNQEVQAMEKEWPDIERYLGERLKHQPRLSLKDLALMDYSHQAKVRIMKQYAFRHPASARYTETAVDGPLLVAVK